MTDNDPRTRTTAIRLRARRQMTLPAWVCDAMGFREGDQLTVTVHDRQVILKKAPSTELDALREIQRAFAASGISEEELQEEGRRVRKELVELRYGTG